MSQSREEPYLQTLKETQTELETIKNGGNWFLTAAIVAAALLYLGSALIAAAWLGFEAFLALEPIWYLAGFVLLSGPAIAIILAGILARQSQRSARANALILRASQLLLMPTETTTNRVKRLATSVHDETARIDETIEQAHASLSSLKESLKSERQSIDEFVARNREGIADMLGKLAEERQALAELTSAVEAQTESISEAIPRQARTMAEAARLAQQEVAKADMAVDERLKALDESGRQLGERLEMLGEMSAEAEKRSQRLAENIDIMSGRLGESARTVDTAIKASKMATGAATETGDALNAAVASALDGTREASEFIRKQAREAVAEALKSMGELKAAGVQAQVSTKAASDAASEEARRTEERVAEFIKKIDEAAAKANSVTEASLEQARQRIERATAFLHGNYAPELPPTPPPAPAQSDTPAPGYPQPASPPVEKPAPVPTPSEASDEDADIFDDETPPKTADQPKPATAKKTEEQAPQEDRRPSPPKPNGGNGGATHVLQESASSDNASASIFDLAFDRAAEKEMGISWKDLLSGLEAEPEERDESARHIRSEIEDAGVELEDLFSAKETRRVSAASRKGERQRRRAVREFAGSAVQTLTYRMEDDARFKASADRFLKTEATDALRALSECDKSRAPASPRLTAYLLLDTARSVLTEQ